MNPFETETMAELCLRQGHREEALDIYRRLLERTVDGASRARLEARVGTIERAVTPRAATPARHPSPPAEPGNAVPTTPSLPLPGVRARRDGDRLIVEWRLPPRTPAPALEVLLVTTAEAGVTTERRAIEVRDDVGRVELRVAGLHSARAAAGSRGSGAFIPLARAATSPSDPAA